MMGPAQAVQKKKRVVQQPFTENFLVRTNSDIWKYSQFEKSLSWSPHPVSLSQQSGL